MTRLIGFSGYARAGKDTAVQVLHTEGYQRVAFADIMREFALRLNPIVGPHFGQEDMDYKRLNGVVEDYGWDGYKQTKYSDEIRGLLQRLGTDCGRELLGDNIWVDSAFKNLDPDGRYAFADCRFVNEANAIRERGGLVIRIERPGIGPANAHPSETSLDGYDFDHVVQNNDSHEVLRQKLVRLIHG